MYLIIFKSKLFLIWHRSAAPDKTSSTTMVIGSWLIAFRFCGRIPNKALVSNTIIFNNISVSHRIRVEQINNKHLDQEFSGYIHRRNKWQQTNNWISTWHMTEREDAWLEDVTISQILPFTPSYEEIDVLKELVLSQSHRPCVVETHTSLLTRLLACSSISMCNNQQVLIFNSCKLQWSF